MAKSKPAPARSNKTRYILLGKDNKPVATLINRALADRWVAENKMGSVKWVEGPIVQAV